VQKDSALISCFILASSDGHMTNNFRTKKQLASNPPIPILGNQPEGTIKRRTLKVEYRPVVSLNPLSRNPRTHSPQQIRRIADSIRKFDFTNPILIDTDGNVLAGHGRLEAAISLGVERVPTIRLDQMTEAEKRAYVLADNKLAENAGWDRELLAIELRDLVALEPEFDLTITGFEAAEADLLIQGIDVSGSLAAADQVPEINESEPPVSRLGDMWRLGDHRLTCADATDTASFAPLLEGKQAQMVFVDPPYNVPIDGHVSGSGSIKHREFAMASGEMSEEEFVAFLTITFGNLITHSSDGSIHFICIDWRHLWEVLSALRKTYAELKNLCVWNKDNGGQGSLYRSKHELILVTKNGTKPHINNVALGRFGRNRTNVWNYPGVNSFRKNRLDDLAMHWSSRWL
jgi:ParB-like nuclease family protein